MRRPLTNLGFAFWLCGLVAFGQAATEDSCDKLAPFEARHAYLSIAGPGPGLGMGGHAYIIISEAHGAFGHAAAFQYNLKANVDGSDLTWRNVRQVLASPFAISCTPAWTMLDRYARENRGQFLFHVDFAEANVRALENFLRSDAQARETHPQGDYSVAFTNCLTMALDAINHFVVNPALKIPSLWHANFGSFFSSFVSPAAATANLPLAFVTTAEAHPLLNREVPLLIRPASYGFAEANMAILRHLRQMAGLCQWPATLLATYDALFTSLELRENRELLLSFHAQTAKCRSSVAEFGRKLLNDDYVSVLSSIAIGAADDQSRAAIAKFIFE